MRRVEKTGLNWKTRLVKRIRTTMILMMTRSARKRLLFQSVDTTRIAVRAKMVTHHQTRGKGKILVTRAPNIRHHLDQRSSGSEICSSHSHVHFSLIFLSSSLSLKLLKLSIKHVSPLTIDLLVLFSVSRNSDKICVVSPLRMLI